MCCMVYTVWGLLYSMVWSAGFYCILCIVVCIILYCMLSIVWYGIVWYNVTLHFVLHFMYFMCHNVFYVFSLMYCTVRHWCYCRYFMYYFVQNIWNGVSCTVFSRLLGFVLSSMHCIVCHVWYMVYCILCSALYLLYSIWWRLGYALYCMQALYVLHAVSVLYCLSCGAYCVLYGIGWYGVVWCGVDCLVYILCLCCRHCILVCIVFSTVCIWLYAVHSVCCSMCCMWCVCCIFYCMCCACCVVVLVLYPILCCMSCYGIIVMHVLYCTYRMCWVAWYVLQGLALRLLYVLYFLLHWLLYGILVCIVVYHNQNQVLLKKTSSLYRTAS